jgi:hypothetical protein
MVPALGIDLCVLSISNLEFAKQIECESEQLGHLGSNSRRKALDRRAISRARHQVRDAVLVFESFEHIVTLGLRKVPNRSVVRLQSLR